MKHTNSKCTFTDFERCIHLPPTKIKNIVTSVLFVTILSQLYIMNTVILEFSDSEHLRIQDKDCLVLINIFVTFMFLCLKKMAYCLV